MFGLNQLAIGLIIIGVLGATNVVTAMGWKHTATALANERAAHKTDVENFKAVQRAADDASKAIEDEMIKESKANAAQAEKNYTALLTQYRTSLVRYKAHPGNTQQANHNSDPTTQVSDGPSASPELPEQIVISGDDADICAINTARLVAVHDWALSLPKGPTQ